MSGASATATTPVNPHGPVEGYGTLLAGLLIMGTGCALANPAIVEAVTSAIPTDKAGAGAGVDGTMTEVGSSLGSPCWVRCSTPASPRCCPPRCCTRPTACPPVIEPSHAGC